MRCIAPHSLYRDNARMKTKKKRDYDVFEKFPDYDGIYTLSYTLSCAKQGNSAGYLYEIPFCI